MIYVPLLLLEKQKDNFVYKSRETDGLNIDKLTSIVMKIIVKTWILHSLVERSQM